MRQKDLAIALDKAVPAHPSPRADLEQYRTPAPIAAEILFHAVALGDMDHHPRVLDLGCGTGMFAVGAALLGADASGVDIDPASIEAAKEAARKAGVSIRFDVKDVVHATEEADLIFTNPPFGAQSRGADRPFFEACLRLAPVSYALHLDHTASFVRAFLEERGASVSHEWTYSMALPWQYAFHEKRVEHVAVRAIRFTRAPVGMALSSRGDTERR
ncbi:MAG: METTL5 family protein [Thermoplasmatota archaeon]